MSTKEERLELYRQLIRFRVLDDLGLRLLGDGRIKMMWHSSAGHEAIGLGVVGALKTDDYLYYNYRGHGLQQVVPKGVDPKAVFAEHAYQAAGSTGGVSGFHIAAPEVGVFGWTGILGAQFGITVGYGQAAKRNGQGQVAVCMFGDGSANKGQFHESLNLSALYRLPVLWVCENNGYSMLVPLDRHLSSPEQTYVNQVQSYGIRTWTVDGRDVDAVRKVTLEALEHLRRGDGPAYIEASAFRRGPHVVGIPDYRSGRPRPAEELAAWPDWDPVALYERKLTDEGILDADLIAKAYAEARQEGLDIERYLELGRKTEFSSLDLNRLIYA